MYKPTYTLTTELLTTVSAIERFYGQVEALKIPQILELNLTRQNMIQSSYASNKIEGNPLTLPEVTNLLLDDRIPANRSEKEVVNYFGLLKNLSSYSLLTLTLEFITSLHGKLLKDVDNTAGNIRNVKVVVGRTGKEGDNTTLRVKHDPPYHTSGKISQGLTELISWMQYDNNTQPVLKAGIFHHEFVYLHPFEDGNGRICRLLTALIMVKSGYLINRYFILDDYYDIDRHQYSDMLHSADNGDKTQWLTYFCDGMKYSLQSSLSRLKTAMRTLSVPNRPTRRENEVLVMFDNQQEITSSDIVKQLKVTRQQAHNLLTALIDKGFVEKRGTTKSSYYVMK